MKDKLPLFSALSIIICICLFLAGGCALLKPPVIEDETGQAEEGEKPPEPGKTGKESEPAEPEKEMRGNSAGNILNGGLVAMQGGQIYFGSRGDGGRLYRAGPDGSGRVKLSDDRAQYINATAEYLYYVAMGEPETIFDELMGGEFTRETYGPIVRVDLEGGGRTVLCTGPAKHLQLAGGKLYYQDACAEEPRIYRINIDGGGKKLLTDHRADFFNVEGGRLYYRGIEEQPQLYRADIDGSGRVLLYDGDAYFMNLLDGNIYFVGDIIETECYLGGRSLYRLGTSGGTASRVGDLEPTFLNCAGGWLYYSKAHSGEICRIRPDGSSQTVLCSDFCGGLFLFESWLYYINIDDGCRLYRLNLDGGNPLKID